MLHFAHQYRGFIFEVPHQIAGAVRSCQVTLYVGVEDLDGWLDKAASREMLLVLHQLQPRLQQLVVGLHVNHVVLIQLWNTIRPKHRLSTENTSLCGSGFSLGLD